MLFEIVHITDYRYGNPVSEAYIETRLIPPSLPSQSLVSHRLEISPDAAISHYTDYFGNKVSFYSMTLRHERLTITNRIAIETREITPPATALNLSVAEARQLFSSALTDVYDYLLPTPVVPTGGPAKEWASKFFPGDAMLGEALASLNQAIYKRFEYLPGATDNYTPLATVWKQRRGVCQDFAHIMLSVLRTAGIPARYVCGYIESEPPPPEPGEKRRRLVGSLATHAWVEALAPGMHWVALDPTNNQWCSSQHVSMAYGRDFKDAAPVHGTFKGSGGQVMKVKVSMRRLSRLPQKS